MKKTYLAIALFYFLISPSIAFANDDDNFFSTIQAGTLGAGINLGYKLNSKFDLRANINGLKHNQTFNIDDLRYEGKINLLTAGLLADYHPFENGFRLSAGVYYNGNKISGNGYAKRNFFGIDPNEFGYETASVKYNKISPYLGFGYQTNNDSNFIISADIGVLYQGKGKVNNSTVCYSSFVCSLLEDRLNEENENQKYKIQDKADKLKFYPVISFGIGYRF